MHLVCNTTPIKVPNGDPLPTGEWLCQDDNAFQLALMGERGTVSVERWTNEIWDMVKSGVGLNGLPAGIQNESVRRILLIRSGAIGDLLLLTPVLSPLLAAYPNATITLCCFERHHAIFQHTESLRLESYPIRKSVAERFDLIIPLENIVELSTEKGQHATDAFAEALGMTVEDYRPVYRVTEEEDLAATTHFPKTIYNGYTKSAPRIALQLHASSVIRNYPLQQWNVVIRTLLDRGWEIMLMGNQDGITGGPPALKDCSRLTFREAAAVLATCDVFCGVDSAFFNLCPALGVPAIGLFGPVDWKTRIKDMGKQRALTTPAECAPCGWTNSRAGHRFPPNGPCAKMGFCVPMAEIKEERIVAKIDAYRK